MPDLRSSHHVADELEIRFASDRYTLAELATFTKAVLPTILAALREGHLEGDAGERTTAGLMAAYELLCDRYSTWSPETGNVFTGRPLQAVSAIKAAIRALPAKTGGRHGE